MVRLHKANNIHCADTLRSVLGGPLKLDLQAGDSMV
jgi:hypothetical protein